MNRRIRLRSALAAMFFCACLSNAFADPASSPQSAWKGSSLKSDASLKDPLVRRGKDVFDARCRACHGAYSKNASQTGNFYALPQMPGTLAMELKYKGQKPALLEERSDLTPEFVAFYVRRGGGGSMPFFRPTEVSADDLEALGAYLSRKR
jgi:mono/diheme cytochrome c family protein